MILTVGNTKGGVGKSTLATNIAIARALAGRSVLLVDADEQATATDFTTQRAANVGDIGYSLQALDAAGLEQQLPALARQYADVVIDVGGRDTDRLRTAMVYSDVLLIPALPRSFDLWALEQIAALVLKVQPTRPARGQQTPLRALVVLNAADSQGKDNEGALEVARAVDGLEVLDVVIGRRKSFSNAGAYGRSVLDYSPHDGKAVDELRALVRAVYAGA